MHMTTSQFLYALRGIVRAALAGRPSCADLFTQWGCVCVAVSSALDGVHVASWLSRLLAAVRSWLQHHPLQSYMYLTVLHNLLPSGCLK